MDCRRCYNSLLWIAPIPLFGKGTRARQTPPFKRSIPMTEARGSKMIPNVDNDSLVYLNGELVRLGDAKVSVLDRGFIFGDGIYEVVPVYHGRPFRIHEHLARLDRSLKKVRIDTGRSKAEWEHLLLDMLERSGLGDCMIYLQVTRGVAKREHGFPTEPCEPTI